MNCGNWKVKNNQQYYIIDVPLINRMGKTVNI